MLRLRNFGDVSHRGSVASHRTAFHGSAFKSGSGAQALTFECQKMTLLSMLDTDASERKTVRCQAQPELIRTKSGALKTKHSETVCTAVAAATHQARPKTTQATEAAFNAFLVPERKCRSLRLGRFSFLGVQGSIGVWFGGLGFKGLGFRGLGFRFRVRFSITAVFFISSYFRVWERARNGSYLRSAGALDLVSLQSGARVSLCMCWQESWMNPTILTVRESRSARDAKLGDIWVDSLMMMSASSS